MNGIVPRATQKYGLKVRWCWGLRSGPSMRSSAFVPSASRARDCRNRGILQVFEKLALCSCRIVSAPLTIVGRLPALEFVEEGELRTGDMLDLLAEAAHAFELPLVGMNEYLSSGMASGRPSRLPSAYCIVPATLSEIDFGISGSCDASLDAALCAV